MGETLLKDPRVLKIGFTGATSTGKHVREVADQNVKRVTAEAADPFSDAAQSPYLAAAFMEMKTVWHPKGA